MKWLSGLIVSLFFSVAHADNVDYSQGNTNPFRQYQHQSASNIANTNDQNLHPIRQHNIQQRATNASCWEKAAHTYGLDPWLLMAVAKVESNFNPNAINRANRNKSVDVGLMQINSYWFPRLEKMGITKQHLFDPCVSIFVGAWIMAQNIRQYGYNQRGIGSYNSMNREIQIRYANRVYKAYEELVKKYYQR